MAKLFKLLLAAVAASLAVACSTQELDGVNERLNDLESRVSALEKLCKEMNSNISSLQGIVTAMQSGDYITSVTPITSGDKTIGYTITFAKGQPITIYHGEDGKDGANGKDGKDGKDGVNGQDGKDGADGHTPVIGVKQDTDGIWYWTLDGQWLLDDNGQKIKAVGVDGKDGADGKDGQNGKDGENGKDGQDGTPGKDGENGKDGQDGADGKDGITPQLKIEDGYWYISYDNGVTWTKLDKAVGADGKDGKDGKDGAVGLTGDSMFTSIDTSDPDYVVFTLLDGTTIKIPTWYAFEQLRTMVNQMNSNIEALQTIVYALQNNDYISSILPIVENGKEVGYIINFTKSGSVTIYHGKDGANGADGKDGKDGTNGQDGSNGQNGQDGKDGQDGADGHTPVIGVKQDTDGVWYWTIDGEWLLDGNGQKVKAVGTDGKDGVNGQEGTNGQNGQDGKDGITPQLKIEEGYWYVSTDNGQTWTQLGKATGENGKDGVDGKDGKDGVDGVDGDSMFQSVTVTETEVTFVTSDGQTFVVKRAAALSIEFDSADLVVMGTNATRNIHYTITSGVDNITIEALSSADIKVKVVKTDAKTGALQVKTGATIDEYSKVVVLVSNGSQAIMRTLNFEAEAIKVEENTTKEVTDKGGEVTLEFFSNVPCHAVIPEDAQSWISVAPETKGMERQSIDLILQPNTGAARSATVVVQSEDGLLVLPYLIEQGPNHSYQLSFERDALIAIYNALDGDNWLDGYNGNWCSDVPISEWYGVDVNAEGYIESLYLTGTGIVPSELESLSYLKRLTINYYLGDVNYEIPSCIFHLQHLEYLHLYGTHLTGTIPSDIKKLQNLKHLEINDTNVGGSIPASLGELNQLEYIDFQWNNLSGELPESIGNLKNLRYVMMRRNELSGNIPQSIQELPIWKYDWGRIIDQNHFNEKSMIIPSPTISGITLDGSLYSYNDQTEGFNVLIQWSAQDDAYLASQIESFNQIYSKYHESVSFVGLVSSSREVGREAVEAYIAENNILWPSIYWTAEENVIDGQELGFDGASRHEYAAPCFPAIFVFHNGRVVYWDLDVYGGVSGLDDYLSVNVLGEQPNYYVSTDYSLDGVVSLVQTATTGNGINIVLMGDAYSDREIRSGKYESNLNSIVNAFFSEEPYKTFRSCFNVYFVNVVSAVEGYEHDGQTLKTFFGSGSFVGGDNAKCIEYAKKCISDSVIDDALIIVSMNDERYSGTCHMFGEGISDDYGRGLSIAYFPMGTLEDITLHEAGGHGFAKLADEYAYEYMGAISADEINNIKQNEPYGWWKNVDFTSDPATVKWSQFLSDPRYANEGLGCFEGGLTYWTGVWRPTEASIMRYNTGGFNAPSRYAIWYRIGKLAYGESWEGSYEDFVAYDAVNRTPAAVQRRSAQRRNYVEKPLPQLPPPVVVGHSWREELNKK